MERKNVRIIMIMFVLLIVGYEVKGEDYYIPPNVTIAITQTATGSTYSAVKFATELINNDTSILPNTTLLLKFASSASFSNANTMSLVISNAENGINYQLCCGTSSQAVILGVASTVYKNILMGTQSTSVELSDKYKYPYFTRVAPADDYQASTLVDILRYFRNQTNQIQYLQVGIIVVTGSYGNSGAQQIIDHDDVTVLTYQQFLSGTKDLSIEMQIMQASKARVFIMVMSSSSDSQTCLSEASDYSLVGDSYVWLCFDGCTKNSIFTTNSTINPKLRSAAAGMIGIALSVSYGAYYDEIYSKWLKLNSTLYPGAGPNTTMGTGTQYYFDATRIMAMGIHNFILAGGFNNVTTTNINTTWFLNVLLNSSTIGITGPISLDSKGNRVPSYDIMNLRNSSNQFQQVAYWDTLKGFNVSMPVEFHSGSTVYPDLDIRAPFNYWSCDKKEKEVDLTGKTVVIEAPGSSNPSNIKYSYYCDSFIDCENLSDESSNGCSTNYLVIFIIYGIATGILIFFAILCLFLCIIFGVIIKRRRIRAASPVFLIIVSLSCILGFASTYTWYGKPQKVACGFQPWLLGIAIVSLISSLCAKNFRIWRIFKSPFDRKIISDLELLVLWFIMLVPAIFILFLWTLISTPDAELHTVQGDKHYICVTGGFTGPPGGFIFFFILVGYCGLLVFFGAFLSFVTRNVPSLYNESKLIAISIYNLAFLSVVIIPVVIVLNSINPFASWLIRTTGILYAFFATLFLQFIPKYFRLFVFDCLHEVDNVRTKDLNQLEGTTSSAASPFHNIPEAEDD